MSVSAGVSHGSGGFVGGLPASGPPAAFSFGGHSGSGHMGGGVQTCLPPAAYHVCFTGTNMTGAKSQEPLASGSVSATSDAPLSAAHAYNVADGAMYPAVPAIRACPMQQRPPVDFSFSFGRHGGSGLVGGAPASGLPAVYHPGQAGPSIRFGAPLAAPFKGTISPLTG